MGTVLMKRDVIMRGIVSNEKGLNPWASMRDVYNKPLKEVLDDHRNLFLNKNLTRKETEKKRDVCILVMRLSNIQTLGRQPFVLLKKR